MPSTKCLGLGCSSSRNLHQSSFYGSFSKTSVPSYQGFSLNISELSTLEVDVDSMAVVSETPVQPQHTNSLGTYLEDCDRGDNSTYCAPNLPPHCLSFPETPAPPTSKESKEVYYNNVPLHYFGELNKDHGLGSDGDSECLSMDSVDLLSATSSLSASSALDSTLENTYSTLTYVQPPPPSPCSSCDTATSPVYANLPPFAAPSPPPSPVKAIFDISKIIPTTPDTNRHVPDLTFMDDLDTTCRELNVDLPLSDSASDETCVLCNCTIAFCGPRPSCSGRRPSTCARNTRLQDSYLSQQSEDKVRSWLVQCEDSLPVTDSSSQDSDSSGFHEAPRLLPHHPVTSGASHHRTTLLHKLKKVGKCLRKVTKNGKGARLQVLAVV